MSRAVITAGAAPPLSKFRDKLKDGSPGPVMVVIPAGKFLMGSPTEVQRSLEVPQHVVTLERFALGETEVTFDEYDKFVDAPLGRVQRRPSAEDWGRGTRPVINVSWEEAVAYTRWLSDQTGEEYRLPSEAEWEYAARAGTTTAFSTGDCITAQQANFCESRLAASANCPTSSTPCLNKTQPVGSYPPNPFELRDMHGNVSEWVQDCLNLSYLGAPTDGSAWFNATCNNHMRRGGDFLANQYGMRSGAREFRIPVPVVPNPNAERDDRSASFGFRVARKL